jgi:hypothetical protein
MDLGHLTLIRSTTQTNDGEEPSKLKVKRFDSFIFLLIIVRKKDIEGARELSYTQFKLKLEDIQLIYANQSNENPCLTKPDLFL